jgi:hypothetical protein
LSPFGQMSLPDIFLVFFPVGAVGGILGADRL